MGKKNKHCALIANFKADFYNFLYLTVQTLPSLVVILIGVKGRIRSCGFIRIFTYTDDVRLVCYGLRNWPCRVRVPAGDRDRKKAAVNPPLRILPLIRKL